MSNLTDKLHQQLSEKLGEETLQDLTHYIDLKLLSSKSEPKPPESLQAEIRTLRSELRILIMERSLEIRQQNNESKLYLARLILAAAVAIILVIIAGLRALEKY